MISALGVMSGYSDGAFRPTDGLSRGAAAKIIAILAMTPDWADNYSRLSPFPDVGPTFVGYINYSNPT